MELHIGYYYYLIYNAIMKMPLNCTGTKYTCRIIHVGQYLCIHMAFIQPVVSYLLLFLLLFVYLLDVCAPCILPSSYFLRNNFSVCYRIAFSIKSIDNHFPVKQTAYSGFGPKAIADFCSLFV